MTESSRSILIVPTRSKCAEEIVTRRALRVLPGRRETFEASWNGRDVIVKVFYHPLKARYHYWRELRGLRRLAELQFRAPVPLLSGRTTEGHWAIVTEKIEDAHTGLELWNRMETLQEKVGLLRRIVVELARQHAKGIVQTDLHLGNFMVRDEKVYALDPAQVRFRRRPLGRIGSINKLAGLLCCLSSDELDGLGELPAAYAEGRQWRWRRQDDRTLRCCLKMMKRRGIKKALKRRLRTSSRTFRLHSRACIGVFDRRFADESTAQQFADVVDKLLDDGEVLKRGRTCSVSCVTWNSHDVVIKRYNHKGFWHSFRHTLKGSRARRNWINALRLSWTGIRTPEPLAYVDKFRGPLLWQSYFITRFVPGSQVHKLFRDEQATVLQKQEIHDKILKVLTLMSEHGISHGDMKHTNILYDGTDIVLTDLDAMCVHKLGWLGRWRCRRDVARYLRDLDKGKRSSEYHAAPESAPGR